jgi:O-antigen/teichoic acid export membrane protein
MLLRHSLLYLLSHGLPAIITMVAIGVYTRLLPPDLYGQYALILAGTLLANSVLFQWLRVSLLRFLPAYGEQPAPLLAALRVGYVAMAVLVLVVGLSASLLAVDEQWRYLILLAIPLIWIRGRFDLDLGIAQSRLAPARYGLLALSRSVLALAGGTAFILLGLGAAGPLLGLTLAMLVPSLVLMGGEWRSVGWRRPAPELMRELLAYGLPLTATFTLNYVITTSDRFLVAWFLGTDAAGSYAASYEFTWNSVLFLMTIINLAGYPLVMRAVEQDGADAARSHLRQNAVLLLAAGLPVLAGAVILAPNMVGVVLGPLFHEDGTRLMPWIAVAAFLGGIMLYYTNLAFQLGRHTAGQFWVMLVAAFVNLALNVLLIPYFGLLGAAWATIAAYVIGVALGWWSGRRVFPLPGLPADAMKPLVAALVMGAALWQIRAWVGAWALVAQIGIGMLVYGIVLALLDFGFGRGRLLRLLRGSLGAAAASGSSGSRATNRDSANG